MAHASRNLRKKRRIKRTNTLPSRSLRAEQSQRYMSHAMLCAILAQQGGEATVTAGTMQQVQANIARLAFRMEPIKDDPSAFVVRLIEAPLAGEVGTTDSIPSGVPALKIAPPETWANQSVDETAPVTEDQIAYLEQRVEQPNGELYGDD